uniref:Glycoprotein 60 n=1 Tax=Cryptosporidium fayeri TaxID=582425 RepID=C0JWE1_9CRYT|nr:glycoprotein 60 [Cryptosporidium fayeri]
MRLSLIIVLLSVIASAVFSAPAVPLRGTLKDVAVESSSSSSSSSSTSTAAPKKVSRNSAREGGVDSEEGKDQESSDSDTGSEKDDQQNGGGGGTGVGAGGSPGSSDQQTETAGGSSDKAEEDDEENNTMASSNTSAATQTPSTPATTGATSEETTTTPKEECGTSFVMWFGEGTPVTTMKCGDYTIVYAPVKGNANPEPRYVSGEVKSGTFSNSDSTVKINIDGKEFSTLSTDSSSPSKPSEGDSEEESRIKSRSKRSLQEEEGSGSSETMSTVDLFSFTLNGGKRIEVAVPSSSETGKRDKYSLVADDKTFYTGSNSGTDSGIYKLDESGNLVDKDNNVLLKDAGSSAFGFRYIIPSVFAIFAAFFML